CLLHLAAVERDGMSFLNVGIECRQYLNEGLRPVMLKVRPRGVFRAMLVLESDRRIVQFSSAIIESNFRMFAGGEVVVPFCGIYCFLKCLSRLFKTVFMHISLSQQRQGFRFNGRTWNLFDGVSAAIEKTDGIGDLATMQQYSCSGIANPDL